LLETGCNKHGCYRLKLVQPEHAHAIFLAAFWQSRRLLTSFTCPWFLASNGHKNGAENLPLVSVHVVCLHLIGASVCA
jgi:hypothetical protein